MKSGHVLLFLSIAVLLTGSRHTAAQPRDSMGTTFSMPIQATVSTMIWNKINEAALNGSQRARRSGTPRSTTTAPQPDVVPAYRIYPPVRFKPTGTRLKLQEMADQLGNTVEARAEMKRVLSGILDKYDAAATAKGYPGDLALAIVSYIGLNARVFHQRTEEPILPFEQNIGLRDTVAESAVDSGAFNNVTDRQKQEMYAHLVMISGIVNYAYEEARKENNAEDLKRCKIMAEGNLKAVGINP